MKISHPVRSLLFISLLACETFATVPCERILSDRIANPVRGISELLTDYRRQKDRSRYGKREQFAGTGKKDIYNPTAPFNMDGTEIIAARVESRNSETDTEVKFFQNLLGTWVPVPESPTLKLQDPFHSNVGNEHIIGGVETFERDDHTLGYKTVFYRGEHLKDLKRFAEGPVGMKDIRISAQPDGKILVFTRPQGKLPNSDYDAGPGKIGVITLNTLNDLTPEKLYQATILENIFAPGEWGGVNEVIPLNDGRMGILMHVARFDKNKDRHYYPAAMTYDPATKSYSKMKILLERKDLPNGLKGASKRIDLADVLFSGGIRLNAANGTAILYVGAGDAEVYSVQISNPF